MEDHQIIELRPNVTTLVMAYGGFLITIISSFLLARSQFNLLNRIAWSSGTVILLTATFMLILTGASYVMVAMIRRRTLTLDRQGIRLRMNGKESLTTWQKIDQVIYTRISFGKSTNSAVVVESRGRTVLKFGSGYTISLEDLFELIDNYVKSRSISVPVVGGTASWNSNLGY